MIWNAPLPAEPVKGDLKIVKRFAWFPKQIGDRKIWLESYQQLYEYRMRSRAGSYGPQLPFLDWDLIGEKVLRGLPRFQNPPPPPGQNDQKEWDDFVKDQTKQSFNGERGNTNSSPDRKW